MSETNQNAPATNQLFDNIWNVEPAQQQVQQQAAEGQAQPEPTPTTQPEPTPNPEPTPQVDYNSFVKEKFGFESVEQAQQEFERVRNFKEPEPQYKTIEELLGDKEEELSTYLSDKKKLNSLLSAQLDGNIQAASEIVKLAMQKKNPELTSDDAEFMFAEKYPLPSKPILRDDEMQEDYDARVAQWQEQVDRRNRQLTIEAKMSKPELEKYKTELKYPQITAPQQPQQEAPSQEELAKLQAIRDSYVATLNEDYSKFEGFNAPFKDEEVEFSVPYTISDEEKTSLKAELENFDSDAFFEERWFTKEGRPNVNQMMADLYLLKNRDRIFQKIANEAGSQRLLAKTKQLSNVNVNGNGQNTFVPDQKNQQQQLLESIWNN